MLVGGGGATHHAHFSQHFGNMTRCNRPEFPPSQFFPRGKNGPAHSFPGEKIGRPILSPPSQFFPPPIIISKIIMELLFLCINLKSRYKISDRTQEAHTYCCLVVISRGSDHSVLLSVFWFIVLFHCIEILSNDMSKRSST